MPNNIMGDGRKHKEYIDSKGNNVRKIAKETGIRVGDELGIVLKLPHYVGEDVAGDRLHKDCIVPWRDFFLGSDGYVRPCMSTPVQFFQYDINKP